MGRKEVCSIGGTKVCRQLSCIIVVRGTSVFMTKKKARKKEFPSQESFRSWKGCMHIIGSQCVCIHFSVGWLSLGFGSLGATEIQTGGVNNIAAGMLDFVL